ncbi:MAG: biotin/lipoyl-binding protein [Oscillospiraceae bacterium]|nr:biotin/lipoyl-binding protein [Oscillospiraceae bacterium]
MSKAIKTLLITTVCMVMIGALLVGVLWYFGRKTEPVPVTPVADHLLGYMGEAPSYDGTVSTNNLQSVYLSGTQTVKEVYVTEGQSVTKGDPLFRYDTTLTDIQLERQRLASEQAQLSLKEAKEELAEIKKMKPYSPPPPTRPTTVPTTAPLESIDELPFYLGGTGTEANPYRYLWAEYLDFDEAFLREHLNAQRTECWLAFEIREKCALGGELLGIWGLHVEAVKPEEPLETYPTEETEPTEEPEPTEETDPTEETEPTEETDPTESTEPTDSTDPTEETEPTESTEPTETPNEDEWKTWELTYRFFLPEKIEHVERPTIPTTRETEWVDTSSGYTAAEIAVMKQEKELEIRDLDLAARMEKLAYETMKTEMSSGIVTATINGTVVNLKDAAMAQVSGEPFLQVTEGGSYFITVQLGEYELEKYAPGSLVTVTSWMNYGYTTTGSLVAVANEPTQNGYYGGYSGNSDVSYYEATIVVPGEAMLQEGEWVGVSFAVDNTQGAEILYLENAYIREENGLPYVYRRNAMGLLEKTYIKTGTVMWGYTAVISGLTEEDWIAFPYGKDVVDGAKTFEEQSDMYLDDLM